MAGIKASPADFYRKFWTRVVKTDTCWMWMGKKDGAGYGKVYSTVGSNFMVLAHRISWRWANNNVEIPKKLQVMHTCDHPSCVNPDHLVLGTAADNAQDKAKKGRAQRGEDVYTGTLTEDKVKQIRYLYSLNEFSNREIATEFNISHNTVGDIVNRKTWKHI